MPRYAARTFAVEGGAVTEQMSRPVFHVSVIAIMIFQVAALFARSMLELALMDDGYTRAVAEDLSYLLVPPILLVLMFPYLRRCGNSLRALFRRADLTFRLLVLSVLLGLALRLAYWSSLTVLIALGVVSNPDPEAVVGPFFSFECPPLPVLLLSLAVTSALVPVVEEVINRGFILHRLLPRGRAVSIAMTALLSAVMHNPGTYAVAGIVGIVLALQTLNFRTLWAPLCAHAAFNGAAVVDWECLHVIWNPPASDPALTGLALLSAPVAVASLCLALLLAGKRAAGAARRPGGRKQGSQCVGNTLDDV